MVPLQFRIIHGRVFLVRFLIILSSFNIGGSERYIVSLANYLSVNNSVFLYVINKDGPLSTEVLSSVSIILSNYKRSFFSIGHLSFTIRSINPDILFSSQSHVNLITLISKWFSLVSVGVSIIREASTPSQNLKFQSTSFVSFKSRSVLLLSKLIYRCANIVLVPSAHVLEDCIATFGIPRHLLFLNPNPVEIDKLKLLSIKKIDDYNFNTPNINFISIGRLTKSKNISSLLKAFSKLVSSGYKVKLLIIGDGEEKETLKSQSNKLNISNHVWFSGHKSNPFPYIKKSDFLVIPSFFEGFPNVLLQALALQKICIVTPFISDLKNFSKNLIITSGFGWSDIYDEMVNVIKKSPTFKNEEVKLLSLDEHVDNILKKIKKIKNYK